MIDLRTLPAPWQVQSVIGATLEMQERKPSGFGGWLMRHGCADRTSQYSVHLGLGNQATLFGCALRQGAEHGA
jgi:hypothetical protein